jgi:hypothetical protein
VLDHGDERGDALAGGVEPAVGPGRRRDCFLHHAGDFGQRDRVVVLGEPLGEFEDETAWR